MLLFGSKNILSRDVMSKDFILVEQNLSIEKCVEIMLEKNANDIFVKDSKGKVIGVFTLTDISMIKTIGAYDKSQPIKKYMNKYVITAGIESTLEECRNIMLENSIGVLPILEDKKIAGVIRSQQIRDFFYMKIEEVSMKLRHIIDSIHEAICVVDADGIVNIWNKNAERLYKMSSENIVGKSILDFFPDAAIAKVLKNRKEIENEYHSPRKDTHIVISALPIYINGEFIGVVSTDRDITEVRQLSQKLESANTKLSFLEDEVKRFSGSFGNIIGRSPKLIKKIEIARHVAKSDASIIITGESGTGKEVFARAIHEHSEKNGLFVPVNCSAIPGELFESELFGYDPGAFTGANKKGKMGIFELANGGTVFLDEIGDMPMHMQAKLLRVLQEKEIMRVGGEKKINIDARIISATHKNLKRMVEEGKFREDLFYRLNVVEIDLPSLKDRKEDILLLVEHFLKELCKKNNRNVPEIEKNVLMLLQNYEWKGNIRELKNTVEHLIVLNREDVVDMDIVPRYIVENVKTNEKKDEYPLDLAAAVETVEKNAIVRALEMAMGNKAKAAKILNIPRSTLYYKMENHGL
ncbi:PAS domain S-box-containing protein [Peptoclostridium litorale DSM 5388]|uniref:Sigma 54 transcriptional activator n=1 Tax=Peptoclostridium litorale DSM 5388 TaxID=1121324 RepID=A0A069R9W3_PEPLI|nr:sigma-54 dependent transcriptional regulator PrdR [Peptoclostridium litorale]KDR93859.1 sigma 54 transcriptional activator PrdR [Peptoclostridium litorale DSM 5388]KDR95286.1 sigma 54 transcriptional activator [Peptoclostridium litorale DSM 5388]SIN87289.1 PAS domain S-box-containing protein [Peptoclostridium litorale DSM 5388]